MTSIHHTVLYTGVTRHLSKRIYEHKEKIIATCFTAKYQCCKLVYYEPHDYFANTIQREKTIKKWRRNWKLRIITDKNPDWIDLYHTLNS